MDYNRHVCLRDLNNYLKKNEYLSGYTPVEQDQIRKNIGAVGEDELVNYLTNGKCIELTYDELQNLIKNKKLGIGQVYLITDFQSIYSSNVQTSPGVYQTWGSTINPSKIFKIITLALTSDTLYNRVVIQSDQYPNSTKWIVEYDYEQETLSDGEKTKGKITYLKDSNNNIAYYDFKNIKSRRTKNELQQLGINIKEEYLDLYTFNTQTFEEASESFNIYNNQFEHGSKDNVFIGNECYNNVFKYGFVNNTFVSSCHNNYFSFNTFNNNFKQKVIYLTGSFNNLNFIDNTYTSLDIDKQISKVDEGYVISYLDPDTLTLQVHKL